MEQYDGFAFYVYETNMIPGDHIQIKRTATGVLGMDISKVVTMTIEEIKQIEAEAESAQKAVFEELKELAKKWDKYAGKTILCK